MRLWFAGFIALCAVPDTEAQSSALTTVCVEGLTLPRTVGGFRLEERQDFADRRLGSVLGYERPGFARVAVIVFPIATLFPAQPLPSAEVAIDREYALSKENIYTLQQRSGAEPPIVLSEDWVQIRTDSSSVARGRHGSFVYTLLGRAVQSHLWVFTVHDRYLKIRAYHDQLPPRPSASAELNGLIEVLLASSQLGPADGPALRLSCGVA